GRMPKGKFKKLVSPVANFTVEYPDSKEWKLLPGQADVIMTIAEVKNGEASVAVERTRLRGALTADDMAVAAESEATAVRDRQPDATNLRQQVIDADNR